MSDKQLTIPKRCGPCQQAGGKARRANFLREKMSKLRIERAWERAPAWKRCQRERSAWRTQRKQSRAGSALFKCPVIADWTLKSDWLEFGPWSMGQPLYLVPVELWCKGQHNPYPHRACVLIHFLNKRKMVVFLFLGVVRIRWVNLHKVFSAALSHSIALEYCLHLHSPTVSGSSEREGWPSTLQCGTQAVGYTWLVRGKAHRAVGEFGARAGAGSPPRSRKCEQCKMQQKDPVTRTKKTVWIWQLGAHCCHMLSLEPHSVSSGCRPCEKWLALSKGVNEKGWAVPDCWLEWRQGWRGRVFIQKKCWLEISFAHSNTPKSCKSALGLIPVCYYLMSIKTPIIKLSVIQTSHFNLEENQHNLNTKQAAPRKLKCCPWSSLTLKSTKFCCHVMYINWRCDSGVAYMCPRWRG